MWTTAEVAERLGVRPATVYTYVSRGLLHPVRTSRSAGSRFHPEEVEELRRNRGGGSAGGRREVATGVSTISDGRLVLRGLDAVDLARGSTFEQVATLVATAAPARGGTVWELDPLVREAVASVVASDVATAPTDRMRIALAVAAAADPLRGDLRTESVFATLRTIVVVMVESLRRPFDPAAPGTPIAARLVRNLTDPGARDGVDIAVDRALSLLCEHELAPSTIAARIAAASRADPYGVVLAGMSVGSGSIHGVSPFAIEDYLRELDRPGPAAAVLVRGSTVGTATPGFGHPLYPGQDPRAQEILQLLAGLGGRRAERVAELLDQVARRDFPPPNAHFALGALSYVGGLARGSAEAVFATARCVGWVAHAVEEYARNDTPVRRRAAYIGAVDARD